MQTEDKSYGILVYHQQPLPLAYDLLFDIDSKSLIIVVNKKLAERLTALEPQMPILQAIEKVCKFGAWSVDEHSFGYLPTQAEVDNFNFTYRFTDIGNQDKRLKIICALHVLFIITIISSPAEIQPAQPSINQSLLLENCWYGEHGLGEFAIGGQISQEFFDYTNNLARVLKPGYILQLPEVEEAMIAVYYFNKKDFSHSERYNFKCYLRPDTFGFSCPGNACDLDYNISGSKNRLSPHNIDSSFQQLTLLAGLAKLNQCFREQKTFTQ
ncbi:MAG: hypothetical protein PHW95_05590 [Patescibacteria group bacterium]|nr:hypothetical protein [Patescibacteria group bacterium]